jgi:hypothetical protein
MQVLEQYWSGEYWDKILVLVRVIKIKTKCTNLLCHCVSTSLREELSAHLANLPLF